jgi:hypothetical protein
MDAVTLAACVNNVPLPHTPDGDHLTSDIHAQLPLSHRRPSPSPLNSHEIPNSNGIPWEFPGIPWNSVMTHDTAPLRWLLLSLVFQPNIAVKK